MKKQFLALSLAGLAIMVASPVLAKEDGVHLGNSVKDLISENTTQFVVVGDVQSVGSASFVVKALASAHVSNVTNDMVTIKTDSNTKIFKNSDKKDALQLSDLKAGQKVLVMGKIDGSNLTASTVRLIAVKSEKSEHAKNNKQVVSGAITAKSGNSVTITDSLTSVSKTITTDADTKVSINGQSKSLADINVGDHGFIKFRMIGSTLIAKFISLFR